MLHSQISIILLLSFFLMDFAFASQAETFIFEFAPSSVVVTSAEKKNEGYNIIIKNRMLMPLKARLETLDLSHIIPISVPAGKDRTYKFKWIKGKSYRLLPLSPPFEEIFLEVGRPVYEIPPKK